LQPSVAIWASFGFTSGSGNDYVYFSVSSHLGRMIILLRNDLDQLSLH